MSEKTPDEVADALVHKTLKAGGAIGVYVGDEQIVEANTSAYATGMVTRLRRAIAAAIQSDRETRR